VHKSMLTRTRAAGWLQSGILRGVLD
jgi:hypothetical protein